MPWSPLLTTRRVTKTIAIKCTRSEALAFIQNPQAMIDLNPLVVSRSPHPEDPHHYTIRDRISMLGRPMEFDYTVKFNMKDDGYDADVKAPGPVTMKSKWSVREVEGGVEVTEDVEATTYFFLMPTTLKGLGRPHEILREKLAAKLEGREVLISQEPQSTPLKSSPSPKPTSNPTESASSLTTTTSSTTTTHETNSNKSNSKLPLVLFIIIMLSLLLRCAKSDSFALIASSISIPRLSRAVLITLCFSFYMVFGRKSKDPYGTFHLSLNRKTTPTEDTESRGSSGDASPETEWLNMGYWRYANTFPEACEALAMKLVQAGRCQEGGHVLDVGHGSGDSLLLHLRHPSIPRPSRLTGITSLQAHHIRSLERVNQVRSESTDNDDKSPIPKVELYHGDAVHHPQDTQHPFNPNTPNASYTTILALDCAYHFRTRELFLKQAFEHLSPGGTVAFADVCFASEEASFGRRVLRLLGVMPAENMVSIETYRCQMEDLGYVGIQVEDITEDVFPGFAEFMSSRGFLWGLFSRCIRLLHTVGGRFVIISGRRP